MSNTCLGQQILKLINCITQSPVDNKAYFECETCCEKQYTKKWIESSCNTPVTTCPNTNMTDVSPDVYEYIPVYCVHLFSNS